MMFLLDIAFAVELIALGLGACLLGWALRNEGAGVTLLKVIGCIITIGAILGLLCTSFYGFKYWNEGYFSSPIAHKMMMRKK